MENLKEILDRVEGIEQGIVAHLHLVVEENNYSDLDYMSKAELKSYALELLGRLSEVAHDLEETFEIGGGYDLLY